jgi:hypothetical protein
MEGPLVVDVLRSVDKYFNERANGEKLKEEIFLDLLEEVFGESSTIPILARLGVGARKAWVLRYALEINIDENWYRAHFELDVGDEVMYLGTTSYYYLDVVCHLVRTTLGWRVQQVGNNEISR